MLTIIFVCPLMCFAQQKEDAFSKDYTGKYVRIFLDNGQNFDCKILDQSTSDLKFEIYGGEVTFMRDSVTKVVELDAKGIEKVESREKQAITDGLNSKVLREKEQGKQLREQRENKDKTTQNNSSNDYSKTPKIFILPAIPPTRIITQEQTGVSMPQVTTQATTRTKKQTKPKVVVPKATVRIPSVSTNLSVGAPVMTPQLRNKPSTRDILIKEITQRTPGGYTGDYHPGMKKYGK